MIPEFEISECLEFEIKSKIGIYFLKKKYLKNILLGFIKFIFIFMSITKKKCKLIKMEANTYSLELMLILLNIF